ncbi:hypothetical protein BpHYR1_054339 [Brachionus plicatilis]|uniref:Uncharacterized protein n=1 Tax=Brachionus plicatilis TaxID=10195 RepID=A0A3M7S4D3_BRAPC|nr:hypothetical protein BpHYR1_054339 [Brachionus plicatilis]
MCLHHQKKATIFLSLLVNNLIGNSNEFESIFELIVIEVNDKMEVSKRDKIKDLGLDKVYRTFVQAPLDNFTSKIIYLFNYFNSFKNSAFLYPKLSEALMPQ